MAETPIEKLQREIAETGVKIDAMIERLKAGSPPPPPPPPAWVVPDPISITIGTPVDLVPTLPSAAIRGGRFSVSPNGAQLPPGVALSSAGMLTGTVAGSSSGVVFQYEEP